MHTDNVCYCPCTLQYVCIASCCNLQAECICVLHLAILVIYVSVGLHTDLIYYVLCTHRLQTFIFQFEGSHFCHVYA